MLFKRPEMGGIDERSEESRRLIYCERGNERKKERESGERADHTGAQSSK